MSTTKKKGPWPLISTGAVIRRATSTAVSRVWPGALSGFTAATIGNPALYELAVLKVQQGHFYEVPIVSVTGRTIPGQMAMIPVLRLGGLRMVNIVVTFAMRRTERAVAVPGYIGMAPPATAD